MDESDQRATDTASTSVLGNFYEHASDTCRVRDRCSSDILYKCDDKEHSCYTVRDKICFIFEYDSVWSIIAIPITPRKARLTLHPRLSDSSLSIPLDDFRMSWAILRLPRKNAFNGNVILRCSYGEESNGGRRSRRICSLPCLSWQ